VKKSKEEIYFFYGFCKKHLSLWTTNRPKEDKNMVEDNKDLEALHETTEGLGFEDFYNIMVTVKKITESYRKLNPNVKDESYAEMWLKIGKINNRPEQDEQKIIEAYKKLYPDIAEITFENLKVLTKIGT
jgi:hypothetical protein